MQFIGSAHAEASSSVHNIILSCILAPANGVLYRGEWYNSPLVGICNPDPHGCGFAIRIPKPYCPRLFRICNPEAHGSGFAIPAAPLVGICNPLFRICNLETHGSGFAIPAAPLPAGRDL